MNTILAALLLRIIRPLVPDAWYATLRRQLIKQRLVYVRNRFHSVPIPAGCLQAHGGTNPVVAYFTHPGLVAASARHSY